MSKDMDNKILRVAYYDCAEYKDPFKRQEAEKYANESIKYIERDGKEKVVLAILDPIEEDVVAPYLVFVHLVANGYFGKIDKVVLLSKDMIGEATKTWLMYHWLKKAGIALEYLIDGIVDDKFVEPYYYLEERKPMLEEFHESLKLNK